MEGDSPVEYLVRLTEERIRAWERAKEIMDGAAAEGRDLTAEEDANLSAINADLDSRDARIKELMAAEERAQAADETRSRIGSLLASAPERAIVTAEPSQSDRLHTMLRNKSGSGEFAYDTRVLSNFATAIIPTLWADKIAVYARTMNPTLGIATVISSNSGEPMTFPRLTADPAVYTPGEGTAITAAEPTISTLTLTVLDYKTLTYVSQEMAQDESYGIEDYIAKSAGRALGLAAGTAFTTGAAGFVTLGSNGGTSLMAGTPAFFGPTDLMDLLYSLASPYRAVASFQVSASAIVKIRKFTDTYGQFLWGPSYVAGQPDTLLGRPVFENPAMATVASASKSVAVGDFSAYMVKALPLRVEVSSDFAFNLDNIAVKCVLRTGGTLPDAAAIKYLVSHTA
jgi:HK97 family phage major capsid protein